MRNAAPILGCYHLVPEAGIGSVLGADIFALLGREAHEAPMYLKCSRSGRYRTMMRSRLLGALCLVPRIQQRQA